MINSIIIALLMLVLGALAVIFLETGFNSTGNFCKRLILTLLVVVFFSPGKLIPIIVLSVLAGSLVFDFFVLFFGFGNPDPHPLGSLLGNFVVLSGSILAFLLGVASLPISPDKKRPLRWN